MAKILSNQATLQYTYTDNNQNVIAKETETCPITTYVRTVGEITLENFSLPQFLEPGNKVTYTILVTNNSINPLSQITITDQIPATQATFNNDTVVTVNNVNLTKDTDYTATYTNNNLVITFLNTTQATIPSEKNAKITFTANALNTLAPNTSIPNTATIVKDGETYTSTATSTVSFGRVDMEKQVVDSTGTELSEIVCGETFYYKITLTNPGDKVATIDYDGTAQPITYGFIDEFPESFAFDVAEGEEIDDTCIKLGTDNDPLSATNQSIKALKTGGSIQYEVVETPRCKLSIGDYDVSAIVGDTPTNVYLFIKGKFSCD